MVKINCMWVKLKYIIVKIIRLFFWLLYFEVLNFIDKILKFDCNI